jgi:hypothetical protein
MEQLQLAENLAWGALPGTELTCFTYHDARLSANLMLSLDREDLGTMVSLLLESLITNLKPGQFVQLGLLANRPLGLILTQVCDAKGQAQLVFRLHQRDHIFDSAVPLERVSGILSAMSDRHKAMESEREVVGEVLDASSPLRLRGQDGQEQVFQRVDGISHLFGRWGEFLQPGDMAPGTRVRVRPVWASPEIHAYLRAQILDDRPAPAPVGELCQTGQEKDDLLVRGQVYAARSGILALLGKMARSGTIDAYLLGKCTLNVLLGYVLVGDNRAGHSLWVGKFEVNLLNDGIRMIERGQLDPPDLILYKMISAYFQSLNTDISQGVKAVNGEMSIVLKYCRELDPSLTGLALRNWRLHLNELFEGKEVPAAALKPWEAEVKLFGRPVLPKVLCYPNPARWVLPEEEARPLAPPRPIPFWKRILGLGRR